MSVWLVVIVVCASWLCLLVGFLGGAFWASSVAASRQIEAQDHQRYMRDELVRDVAEMALDGDDWGRCSEVGR